MNYIARYKTVMGSYTFAPNIEELSEHSFEAKDDEEAKRIAEKYKENVQNYWEFIFEDIYRVKERPTLESLVEVREVV